MPPASRALAAQWIPRLERTLELKEGKNNGRQRLYVRLLDGKHEEYKLWLSHVPEERIGEIVSFTPVQLHDMNGDFEVKLLAGSSHESTQHRLFVSCSSRSELTLNRSLSQIDLQLTFFNAHDR